MSEVKVNKISPRSGTDVQLGDSGDTITVPTGATLDASNATTTLPSNIVTTDGTQTLTNKSIAATQLTGTITPSDNTVSLAKLTATGTKDATTFLRGDNTFSVPAGGVNTPAFLATTSLGNTTTGATTLFKFDSEIFDTDNCFNNTAGNYRFTPTTAGKYFLYTQTLPYNVGPTYNLNDRQLYIMKNGTAIARCTQLTSGGSTYGEEMNCSVIGEANGTTDYFDVRYEITVGSSTLQHDGGACNFFGYKIIE